MAAQPVRAHEAPRALAVDRPGSTGRRAGRRRPPGREEGPIQLENVTVAGYVEDLDELLASSSVLLAPVSIGGGVGVGARMRPTRPPVVGTPEAIGSIGEYLPVSATASDDAFCAQAIELLSSPQGARDHGSRLFAANRELWASGFVHEQVRSWIAE